jgi:hypothetical protein
MMDLSNLGVLAQATVELVREGAEQAQQAAGQVGAGRIQGGWRYVWTSYAITWGSLALYSLSLWWRRPKALPKE